jgi:hypothetical protein
MMKVAGFFKTSVPFNQPTRGHIPEHRNLLLTVSENSLLRTMFGAKRKLRFVFVCCGENCIMRSSAICTSQQTGQALVQ